MYRGAWLKVKESPNNTLSFPKEKEAPKKVTEKGGEMKN